jgi:aminopeptidase N
MPATKLQPILLKNYAPPPFLIDRVELTFDLEPTNTEVTALTFFRRNPDSNVVSGTLELDGEDLELKSVTIDGQEVAPDMLTLTKKTLTLNSVPDTFTLRIVTIINPEANSALEGLYISSGRFCTQCEAEGFRRLTYYPDRPDVLARFRVKIIADSARYPLLLSNGNRIDHGTVDDQRHFTVWDDPFPKPCYLFALVAGDLANLSSTFKTTSGRDVVINIYVENGKEAKAVYAMDSLKRAMEWDQDVYGLEYDLDAFNIVAVSDFNMGAMENKSLNIFNDKFILADPMTATDTDYAWIESVVAHEYFHNWTGNRVTCRDWFQLSLKEGLTVFRDQQFSGDQRSAAVQRIEDVRRLRATQFTEDAGPLAHPVRPDSYAEINNFYTHTVYEKGAEVVRMIHTLIGAENFRKGMDLYCERHDGQAVTCEDFVSAMADASDYKFDQFLLWYSQAGTPLVEAEGEFNSNTNQYLVTLRQSCDATPGQTSKQPMHIPIAIGFVDKDSGSVSTSIAGGNGDRKETHLISLVEKTTTLKFEGFPESVTFPVISLNRGFTAPIQTKISRKPDELAVLMTYDPDPLSRWNATQDLALSVLMEKIGTQNTPSSLPTFLESLGKILGTAGNDEATTALLLELPGEQIISDKVVPIEPVKIHEARLWLKQKIGQTFGDFFLRIYSEYQNQRQFLPTANDAGIRSLRRIALDYIVCADNEENASLAFDHYNSADNMTDLWSALVILNETNTEFRRRALDDFATRYENDNLVLDKWLMLEATHMQPSTLDRVKDLLSHEKYNDRNPNKIRALIGAFAAQNIIGFHQISGAGYEFVAEQILEIDKINPQVASRLTGAFQQWSKYDAERKEMMHRQLIRIRNTDDMSEDVMEIVSKSLISARL